jgi:ABC-type antimicrobial peptide transport system permease subunit
MAAAANAAPVPPIVVETSLARKLALAPGDTVALRLTGERGEGRPFVVTGTFAPPPDPSGISRTSKSAWMRITDLERLSGRRDRVSRFILDVAPGVDLDSMVTALNTAQLGYTAYRADDVARRSSRTFVVISNFHKAISFLSILAGSAFLAAIVLLQVQELRKSLGVLRVIGFSKTRIYTTVVGETVLLANVGATIGVVLALVVSRGVNAYYQHYFDTALVFSRVTASHVLLAYGVATVVGVVVGSLATTYLFKLRVNEVLGR